jgi:PAS domain S-box-containing protein
VRDLLCRVTRGEGALGAACIAGLLACGLILIAALTLENAQVDRRSEAAEIRTLVSSGRELGRVIASAAPDNQPAAPQAWNRFAASLDRACGGLDVASPYRALLDRLCHGRDEIVDRMTPQIEVWGRSDSLDEATMREVVAIRADLDRLAERDDVEAAAHIESMARSSRNALLVIIGGIVAFVCASLIAAVLVLRVTNPYRRDLLRETIEALPAGVVLYDSKERLVMFNSLADDISPGADLAKSIGRTYAELAAENGRKLEAMGQGPQPVDEWVARFRRKDTQRTRQASGGRWFDWSERLTPGGYTVGLRVDVTEKKRHEEALEHARAEYQSLVDSLTDVVFKVDFYSGLIIFANAAARDFFGRPVAEIVGTPVLDCVQPEDRPIVAGIARTAAQSDGEVGDTVQIRMIAAGGALRHVEVRYRKIVDEQGRKAIAGVIRDIEERVQLARRLAAETARLRSIIESSGALVALVDRDLDVVMVNSGFSAMTGIAAADAIGRPINPVIEGPLRPALDSWQRAPTSASAAATPARFAVKLGLAGGADERLVSVTATPVADGEGRICNVVLVGVDETERRRAEQALHDSERFATVGEMAGTMAHELSQPLQVINLACAAASEELDDARDRGAAADADYLKVKLDRIAQQVDAASRIVGDLRAFVRGEADRQPAPFDPGPAIERALNLTGHGMRQAGIAASSRLAEGLPAVAGDIGRLEQVMVNLLNNARDAGGRTVEVVAHAAERDGRPFLRIAVQDSGHGIAPELLPQLFVSFVTTKPRGTGTGLGLRICRRIIEEMGGSIAAANRAEGGACFEILLPAARLAGQPRVEAA